MAHSSQKTHGDASQSKVCIACGRTITWRRKWAKNWDQVRYCSDACRKKKTSGEDAQLESVILSLLANRSQDKTICPSEAARAVGGAGWRDLMEPARAAARRLVMQGKIEITQQGRPVDPSTAKGPIRLRLRRD